VHRLDPSSWQHYEDRLQSGESRDIATPHRHVRTRLYMTSESHVHSVIGSLRYGSLFKDMNDAQWQRAISHLNHISELSYLTQIVFMQYEDPTADPLSEDRFHIEVFFSPGVKTPDTDHLAEQLSDESTRSKEEAEYIDSYNIPSYSKEELIKQLQNSPQRQRRSPQLQSKSPTSSSIDKTSNEDVCLGHSLSNPVRMSLQPMAQRVNSGHISHTKTPSGLFSSSPVNSIDEGVSIRGADVIETLPSLHPLVCLHSSIGQKQMETFLNELMEKEAGNEDRCPSHRLVEHSISMDTRY